MSQKQYDLVFFIGRFQPPTKAHIRTMLNAIDYGDKVCILVGSVDIARDPANPFTFDERRRMIHWALEDAIGAEAVHQQYEIRGVIDDLYNNQIWAMQVQNIVYNLTGGVSNPRVALIGHKKDASSFYLDMFPQWDFIEQDNFEGINATDVRKTLFEDVAKEGLTGDIKRALSTVLPQSSIEFLNDFTKVWNDKDIFGTLVGEYNYLVDNKAKWAAAPYPHKDVTVDACVVQSGHVLLIQRKRFPGINLWAMPGGHLEIDEEIEDGMIRELREETRLKVPAAVLKGSVFREKVFAHPKRSLRGRIITHAYGIQLKNGPLPAVKARDDAKQAVWTPIAEFYRMRDQFFEDHFSIIDYFLKRIEN